MILDRLDRDRFEPVAACPADSRMTEMMRSLNVRTRDLRPLDARFTWRLDRMVRYLVSFALVILCARRIVIEEAPDAIHANSIRAGMVMSAATLGTHIPIVWHAHDILPRHPLSTAIRLFAMATKRNRILAVSGAVSERFRGVILRPLKRRVPLVVIHNAVDLQRFQASPNGRNEIRRSLGLGKTQRVVGIVGQLTPRKGQLELIQAFAHASCEVKDAVLLIVGASLFNSDDEYVEQLQSAVESLGIRNQVSFLGQRDDIPQIMQGIDVLAVNSHEEPFALTVLEGLSSGIPVLATAVGGTPEMIQHGENGWLVPARDCNALAQAIVTLLSSATLRGQLGRKGRREAMARFSMARFYGEVAELYGNLLAGDQVAEQDKPVRSRKFSLSQLSSATFFRSLF